jgi:hypothetical protein
MGPELARVLLGGLRGCAVEEEAIDRLLRLRALNRPTKGLLIPDRMLFSANRW